MIPSKLTVDDCCEACGRSVCEPFPGYPPPVYCEACDAEFWLELRAGHVSHALTGEVFLPAEGSR